jgi:hypothetical protein
MCWLCSTALDGIEDPSAEQNRNLGMGDGFALAASEAQIRSQFPSHSSSFVAVHDRPIHLRPRRVNVQMAYPNTAARTGRPNVRIVR